MTTTDTDSASTPVSGKSTTPSDRESSKVFTPWTIANGRIPLKHRIVMAPMTRNRGVPVDDAVPTRVWAPDDLAVKYYSERATPGGLLITEGTPPNLEGNGTPAVPGLWLEHSQAPRWKKVVDAVHSRGAYIYVQMYHCGRTALPFFTGYPASVSSSATPFEGEFETRYAPPDETGTPGSGPKVKYRDYPPIALTKDHIKSTIRDFVHMAQLAINVCGFDGVEVHGANGYLVDQFLNTNINKRTDEYGGTVEGYCRFPIELMEALAQALGGSNVAIRLSPFSLFNQTKGEKRLEIWSHLCRELKSKIPDLSYIHFIEPVGCCNLRWTWIYKANDWQRFEQIIDSTTKENYLASLGLSDISLAPFRSIMGSTPLISAGGWNDTNVWNAFDDDECDAVAMGRYFVSNPDLLERIKRGIPLSKYDRDRFYWVPYHERAKGYTDYPSATAATATATA